jgi:hypothetical protein
MKQEVSVRIALYVNDRHAGEWVWPWGGNNGDELHWPFPLHSGPGATIANTLREGHTDIALAWQPDGATQTEVGRIVHGLVTRYGIDVVLERIDPVTDAA